MSNLSREMLQVMYDRQMAEKEAENQRLRQEVRALQDEKKQAFAQNDTVVITGRAGWPVYACGSTAAGEAEDEDFFNAYDPSENLQGSTMLVRLKPTGQRCTVSELERVEIRRQGGRSLCGIVACASGESGSTSIDNTIYDARFDFGYGEVHGVQTLPIFSLDVQFGPLPEAVRSEADDLAPSDLLERLTGEQGQIAVSFESVVFNDTLSAGRSIEVTLGEDNDMADAVE